MAQAMRRILVVDDDRDLRDALELTLSRMGHGVELAKNGEQALKVLSSEEYSMMVTDVRMPKMGGIDLLKHARESCPEMPVLVITGYGTINNAVKAMKHGAADYIVKPFPAQTLEQASLEIPFPIGEIAFYRIVLNMHAHHIQFGRQVIEVINGDCLRCFWHHSCSVLQLAMMGDQDVLQ